MNAPAHYAVANTPFFMRRSDGMSDDYIRAASRIATMAFQTLSCLQLHVLDAPAFRPWADVENRRVTREITYLIDGATELAELVLPELGIDPEPLRIEAESSLRSGTKLRLVTVPITSWTDGLVFRWIYGRVLHGQLAGMVGSNLIPLANVAQKLYFELCMRDWPADVGSPLLHLVQRAIEEEGVEPVRKAIEKWWPHALDSFGTPGSKNEAEYLELGLKTRPNEKCRQLFLDGATADLRTLGLGAP
jgi:hypothetical protein